MENSNQNNKDKDEIILKKDNYEINISLKEQNLSLILKDIINNLIYKAYLSKEFLSNKNIFFSYLSLVGIKDFFINLISQSKYKINKLLQKIELIILLENSKENIEILIPLFNKENDESDMILLKSENLNMKEDIKKLKEEINEIKNRLNEIENKISIVNKRKDEWKGFTNKIIKNIDEVKILLNWIDSSQKLKAKLLYTASLEENKNDDFHKKCDGKGATITIVESSKGKRFGGYTRISWNNNFKNWMSDSTAFLFNLDDNKKFKVIKPEYVIYGDNNYGPHFGYNNDFSPGHPSGSKYFIGGSHPSKHGGDSKTYKAENNQLTGESNFNIVYMEVYQILLDL